MEMKKKHNLLASILAFFVELKVYVNERIADVFARWAEIAFDHPYRCIALTFLITAVCAIGFIPGIPKWVDGAESLYALPYSTAKSQGEVHHVLFNETNSRPSFVLLTGKTPGENILTWKHLQYVNQLDQLIRGQIIDPVSNRRIAVPRPAQAFATDNTFLDDSGRDPAQNAFPSVMASFRSSTETQVDDKSTPKNEISKLLELINSPTAGRAQNHRADAGNELLTFQDLCIRNGFGDCIVTGVQEMNLEDLRDFMDSPNDEVTVFVFDGLVYNTQKRAFPPHYLLGHAQEEPCSPELPRSVLEMMYSPDRIMAGSSPAYGKVNMTCIKSATAFQLIYEVKESDATYEFAESWEKVLVDVLNANSELGPLKVHVNAFRSRDDALRSSTSESSDILFVGLTFGLLLTYSTGLNFSCNLFRSKAYPAIAGLVAATLGLVAGMGFMSICQVAFVPTALLCPFLVIGVGTDDLFVIINGYSMTYMIESPKQRCVVTLKETAFGITITTVTSLMTFLIGLNTPYLSIRNFCFFAGSGMFFGYIFVFTLFFPVHCLDTVRELESRACLFSVPSSPESKADSRRKSQNQMMPDISIFTVGALMVRRAEQKCVHRHAVRQLAQQKLQEKQQLATTNVIAGLNAEFQAGHDPLPTDLSQASEHQSHFQMSHSPEEVDLNSLHASFHQDKTLAELKVDDDFETQATESTANSSPDGIRKTSRPQSLKTLSKPWLEGGCNPMRLMGQIFWSLVNGLKAIKDTSESVSDALMCRIALDGHEAGLSYDVDKTPSNGILAFQNLDPEFVSSGDIVKDMVHFPHIPLHYTSLITGQRRKFIEEPEGNVGLFWHQFFIRYYGVLLTHMWIKVLVIMLFICSTCVAIYGIYNLESGLDLKDLAPLGSYLNRYDLTQAAHFDQYDFPVDVFFPEEHPWWTKEAQQSLRELETLMLETKSGKFVTNPVIRMLDDPDLIQFLQSGDQKTFETTLYAALTDVSSKYKQFEQNFVWQGSHLRAWKMQVLPAAMYTSSERASWMNQLRRDCQSFKEKTYPLEIYAYNYMMIFYESDLRIKSSVVTNMMAAAATMLVIALLAIPQAKAGFLVIVVMGMIDIGIIGYMYFASVKLNMVSMICLLIAVGFSVDFSCHICHAYMETEGETRDQRLLETLVVMGNPVLHGAVSSILGVMMLGFSESYIFRVFFKMLTLVIVLALVHGIIFLPVLLSLTTDKRPHHVIVQQSKAGEPKLELPVKKRHSDLSGKQRQDQDSETQGNLNPPRCQKSQSKPPCDQNKSCSGHRNARHGALAQEATYSGRRHRTRASSHYHQPPGPESLKVHHSSR